MSNLREVFFDEWYLWLLPTVPRNTAALGTLFKLEPDYVAEVQRRDLGGNSSESQLPDREDAGVAVTDMSSYSLTSIREDYEKYE